MGREREGLRRKDHVLIVRQLGFAFCVAGIAPMGHLMTVFEHQ